MFLILTFFFCGTQAKIYEIIKHVPLYLSFVDNLSLLAPSSIDDFNYVFFPNGPQQITWTLWSQSSLLQKIMEPMWPKYFHSNYILAGEWIFTTTNQPNFHCPNPQNSKPCNHERI